MSELMHVSSNPHTRSKTTTSKIMLLVTIALLFPTAFGVYNFGINALVIVIISVVSAVAFEMIFSLVTRRKQTIRDFSAIVTGLLLGLNLPVTVPWWIPVLGSFFAIVVVKMLFGGIGQNIVNPAIGARCFLVISFASIMTDFSSDTFTGPTPLTAIKTGEGSYHVLHMIYGNTNGTIGETSTVAILAGAILLLLFGVIDLIIPLSYVFTVIIFMGLFGGKGFDVTYLISQAAGGGLMLGAFFMATDYTTRPITTKGQYLYGILLGLLTGIFRVFGGAAEGVSYAILLGNLVTPLIEKWTIPRAFGMGGKRHG